MVRVLTLTGTGLNTCWKPLGHCQNILECRYNGGAPYTPVRFD